MDKKYVKSDQPQEIIEELFLEITGQTFLPKKEMHRLDAYFIRDENENVCLYYSTQEISNKNGTTT